MMPPGFDHPGRALRSGVDMWAPAGYRAAPFPPLDQSRGRYPLTGGLARLKTGVTLSDAQQRLGAFGERLRAEYPTDYPERAGWTPRLVGLHDDVVGQSRTPLVLILASVGVVLLIACANIAGLLLARSAGRSSRARDPPRARRRTRPARAAAVHREPVLAVRRRRRGPAPGGLDAGT